MNKQTDFLPLTAHVRETPDPFGDPFQDVPLDRKQALADALLSGDPEAGQQIPVIDLRGDIRNRQLARELDRYGKHHTPPAIAPGDTEKPLDVVTPVIGRRSVEGSWNTARREQAREAFGTAAMMVYSLAIVGFCAVGGWLLFEWFGK